MQKLFIEYFKFLAFSISFIFLIVTLWMIDFIFHLKILSFITTILEKYQYLALWIAGIGSVLTLFLLVLQHVESLHLQDRIKKEEHARGLAVWNDTNNVYLQNNSDYPLYDLQLYYASHGKTENIQAEYNPFVLAKEVSFDNLLEDSYNILDVANHNVDAVGLWNREKDKEQDVNFIYSSLLDEKPDQSVKIEVLPPKTLVKISAKYPIPEPRLHSYSIGCIFTDSKSQRWDREIRGNLRDASDEWFPFNPLQAPLIPLNIMEISRI
jgi:hypothetical protein